MVWSTSRSWEGGQERNMNCLLCIHSLFPSCLHCIRPKWLGDPAFVETAVGPVYMGLPSLGQESDSSPKGDRPESQPRCS